MGPRTTPGEREAAFIPTRDRRELAADVFLPRRSGRVPAILVQTPYGRGAFASSIRETPVGRLFLESGDSALVVVDWRGFHGSLAASDGGESLASRGRDGRDVVEWIAAQVWSDGKVGTWGPSALGVAQFQTAVERPPHLACCVPLVSHLGVEHAQYYSGGVLRESYVNALDELGFGIGGLVRDHPLHDGFWRSIERATRPERIDVPLLIVGGWYDMGTDALLETFRAVKKRGGVRARRHTKLLMGPWHHSAIGQRRQGELEYPAAEGEDARAAARFFERWLSGGDEGSEEEASVRWFQMRGEGGGTWREAEDWPPERTREVALYLHGSGRLRSDSATSEGADSFVSDPADPVPTCGGGNLAAAGPMDQRRIEAREDVSVWTTEPLGADVVVCGAPKAVLFVSSDRRDIDVAVRLCDVYTDGRSMLVTDGIRRMRFRSSTEREELMEDGVVYELEVMLPVTAITFVAGHRIRISVSSSNWPRFGVNPQDGENRFDARGGLVARNVVHRGPRTPSRLVLPVLSSNGG